MRSKRIDVHHRVKVIAVGDFECCVLGTDASMAVSRFRQDGPIGYWAKSDMGGVLHSTRDEARAAEHALRASLGSADHELP